jgi:hypothetical protein
VSVPLAVVAHVNRAIFIGHVAGWSRHNPMFADPGACDVDAVEKLMSLDSLIAGLPTAGFPSGGMYAKASWQKASLLASQHSLGLHQHSR